MAVRKGLTLIEIIVVMIIIGILVAIALPNYNAYMEQTRAQTAQNNLLAIAAGQAKYYEDYGKYCVNDTSANCGSLSSLSLNLSMIVSLDGPFSYNCSSSGAGSLSFQCSANDGTDYLTFNPNAQVPTPPVSCFCNSALGGISFCHNIGSCPIICMAANNNTCPSNLQ